MVDLPEITLVSEPPSLYLWWLHIVVGKDTPFCIHSFDFTWGVTKEEVNITNKEENTLLMSLTVYECKLFPNLEWVSLCWRKRNAMVDASPEVKWLE